MLSPALLVKTQHQPTVSQRHEAALVYGMVRVKQNLDMFAIFYRFRHINCLPWR